MWENVSFSTDGPVYTYLERQARDDGAAWSVHMCIAKGDAFQGFHETHVRFTMATERAARLLYRLLVNNCNDVDGYS